MAFDVSIYYTIIVINSISIVAEHRQRHSRAGVTKTATGAFTTAGAGAARTAWDVPWPPTGTAALA